MVFLHAARNTKTFLFFFCLSVSRMDGCFYDESAFVCVRVPNDDESGKSDFPLTFSIGKNGAIFSTPHTHNTRSLSLSLSLSQSRKIYARGDGTTREHSLRENPLS